MRVLCFALVAWETFGLGLVAATVSVVPETPRAGEVVQVIYDPEGRPLAGASEVFVHRAFNNWAAVAGPDLEMEYDEELDVFVFSYVIPEAAYQIDFVFQDGNDNWDNNGGEDWHVEVAVHEEFAPLPGPDPLPEGASKAGVMMQGFYWDVPEGSWYATLAARAKELRFMRGRQGIDRIWFPPPSKGESGRSSMGYDPYDYYDLGQFTQKGTTRTRFGTQDELKAAIAAFRTVGILCMADIVLNHRSGGNWELNPLTGDSYWTDFTTVASGKCTWSYDDFHPSSLERSDEGIFTGFPDVCHVADQREGDPLFDLIEWGNWMKDESHAGFDGGWRLDYVKGVSPNAIRSFRQGTGNAFSILECWDGLEMIEAYLRVCAGASAFDFPAYYLMRDVFNSTDGSEDISGLVEASQTLAARLPDLAVTFVANHDTDEITRNKMLAYAFILTFEGYPCLFWRDYFDRGLADFGGQRGNGIDALVWARGALAKGDPHIEIRSEGDPDLLIYEAVNGERGYPGFLMAINDSPVATRAAEVVVRNKYLRGRRLQPYAWFSYVDGKNVKPDPVFVDNAGSIQFSVPPRGYVLFSSDELAWPSVQAVAVGQSEMTLNVSVRNTELGESYEVLLSESIEGSDTWNVDRAFVGGEGETTRLDVDLSGRQRVFVRIRKDEN